jgi:NAD(P)-dependent dehydrogenase (short-subunit alcohol dehydrogenase family)
LVSPAQPQYGRAERLDQCAYRHADLECLCRDEGGDAFAGSHVVGRTVAARDPCQRGQPGSDRDPAAWQDRHGEAEIAGLVAQTPAGRRGLPIEIAQAVLFLASDESAFSVGSELIIDGGMSIL